MPTLPLNLPFHLTGSATLTRGGTKPYTVSGPSGEVGVAYPIDLRTGADVAGSLVGIPRVPGEDDFSYLGRIQRVLTIWSQQRPSGSAGLITRTVSAYLGRVSITASWDGVQTGVLPGDTSFLDPLFPTRSVVASTLDGSASTDASGLTVLSSVDLTGPHSVSRAGSRLVVNRDYAIRPPATLLLAHPLGTDSLTLRGSDSRGRTLLTDSAALSVPLDSLVRESYPSPWRYEGSLGLRGPRLSSSAVPFAFPATGLTCISGRPSVEAGPFLRGRGVFVAGLDRVGARLLERPTGQTPLGVRLLGSGDSPRWSSLGNTGTAVRLGVTG